MLAVSASFSSRYEVNVSAICIVGHFVAVLVLTRSVMTKIGYVETGAPDNKFLIFSITFHPVHTTVISESKLYNLHPEQLGIDAKLLQTHDIIFWCH